MAVQVAMGADPGKTGAIVATDGKEIVAYLLTPTIKLSKGSAYDLRRIADWLKRHVGLWRESGYEVRGGVEVAQPFPHKDRVQELVLHDRAKQILGNLGKAEGFKPEGRERFRLDTVVETLRGVKKDAGGGKESVKTAFAQGEGVMLWKVCYAWLEMKWKGFWPKTWQAEMLKGVMGSDPKSKAVWVATNQLFPGFNFLPTDRHRKPHQGLVDAAVIAEYTWRYWYAGPMGKATGPLDAEGLIERGMLP
jgi:hypothetical protein